MSSFRVYHIWEVLLYSLSKLCAFVHVGAPLEEDEATQAHSISAGDFVRIELDPEVFRAMHDELYGWSNLMLEVSVEDNTLYHTRIYM